MLTDGRTDIRTYGRTDRPTYRDARTHLKIMKERKKAREKEKKEKREEEKRIEEGRKND